MTINEVVKNNLCLGCGVCTYDSKVKLMTYSSNKGMNIPKLSKHDLYPIADKICPGVGYSIVKEGSDLYSGNEYSVELGYYKELYAAHSNSSVTLKNASSGGVMSEFLLYVLENGIVDRIAVTKFVYTDSGPKTITFLTNKIQDILDSQGSKYCPVDISNVIQEIKNTNFRIAYVGTPCQIAGIRQIQKIDPEFRRKIILTISNFCGGIKSYKQIQKISYRHGIEYERISYLRYRGGGQPGSMLIKDLNGMTFEASYKKYGGFTGYSKLLRCHLCVDATGELADISLGDAWIDKYQNDSFPWSVILTRTDLTDKIILNMERDSLLTLEELSEKQVCESQKQNINSKKVRQFSRSNFYRVMGYKLPLFDNGYYMEPTSLKTEIIVFIKHKLSEFIENIGLYRMFRIITRKEY